MHLHYPKTLAAVRSLEGDDDAVELTPIDPEDMVCAGRLTPGASLGSTR